MHGEPVIVVHSKQEAVAALGAAARANIPILLVSQKDGASFVGAPMFRRMIDLAAKIVPSARFRAALDCGDHPGRALAAIRAGVAMIVFNPLSPAFDGIADIARQTGTVLLEPDAYGPRRLDLSQIGNPVRACNHFLQGKEDREQ